MVGNLARFQVFCSLRTRYKNLSLATHALKTLEMLLSFFTPYIFLAAAWAKILYAGVNEVLPISIALLI